MLSPNPKLVNMDNTITTSIAIVKTNGVYILLNLDTSVSVCAFLSLASSTNSSILATVESLNSVVAFIYIIFPIFIVPDNTLSFLPTFTGSDSPVSADVSSNVEPSVIIPSTGIFSPFFTIKMSPFFTCSTSTLTTFSPINLFV